MKNLLKFFSIENIQGIIAEPRQYAQEIVILTFLFIAILFVLMIVFALIFIKPSQKKEKIDINKILKKTSIWTGVWAIIFLSFATAGSLYTSKNNFCGLCHYEKKYVNSWNKSIHKDVNCVSCHVEPGVVGFFVEKTLLLKRIAVGLDLIKRKSVVTTTTPSNACLRCHQNIMTDVVDNKGVRVKHIHIAEKGYRCVDCHNQVAHRKIVVPPKYPDMADCMECHNGSVASNDCQSCHIERIPISGRNLEDYNKIGYKQLNNCIGCHPRNSCKQCHEVQTPHPPKFFETLGGHKEEAKAVGKDKCLKCHPVKRCLDCHWWPS